MQLFNCIIQCEKIFRGSVSTKTKNCSCWTILSILNEYVPSAQNPSLGANWRFTCYWYQLHNVYLCISKNHSTIYPITLLMIWVKIFSFRNVPSEHLDRHISWYCTKPLCFPLSLLSVSTISPPITMLTNNNLKNWCLEWGWDLLTHPELFYGISFRRRDMLGNKLWH